MTKRSSCAIAIPEGEDQVVSIKSEGGCVLVVGGGRSYYRPFTKFGHYEDQLNILRGSKEEVHQKVNLVLFTGGEDVYPGLYGEAVNSRTSYSYHRDDYECFAFMLARGYDLPMAGVCRGAQFLCVMAGGKLIQHVEHPGRHPVKLWDGRIVIMNSMHHQMQLPPKSAQVIGWMEKPLSRVHLDGENKEIDIDKEVEVAYYPNINAVGMQYHPEAMNPEHDEGFRIAAEFVDKFLFKEEQQEAA